MIILEDKRFKFLNACNKVGINDPYQLIIEKYKNGDSCNVISEFFLERYSISVSAKYLAEKIKEAGIMRSYSERKKNAINKGRMIYRKKPIHELYKTNSIGVKTRLQVLQRDNNACVMCGNGPKTGYSIELHHKKGKESISNNLQTLCFLCHRGLHELQKEK